MSAPESRRRRSSPLLVNDVTQEPVRASAPEEERVFAEEEPELGSLAELRETSDTGPSSAKTRPSSRSLALDGMREGTWGRTG